jgi:hypothetical protein
MTTAVRPSPWPFLAWAAVGAGFCVAALTLFTIGIIVLPLSILALIALLVWRGGRNTTATGLLSGGALVALYVGYLNRGGPGEVCSTTATEQHCVSEWSPWPWLAAGVLLLATSIGLFLRLRYAAEGESRRRARPLG